MFRGLRAVGSPLAPAAANQRSRWSSRRLLQGARPRGGDAHAAPDTEPEDARDSV